jgi:hypothetical protein
MQANALISKGRSTVKQYAGIMAVLAVVFAIGCNESPTELELSGLELAANCEKNPDHPQCTGGGGQDSDEPVTIEASGALVVAEKETNRDATSNGRRLVLLRHYANSNAQPVDINFAASQGGTCTVNPADTDPAIVAVLSAALVRAGTVDPPHGFNTTIITKGLNKGPLTHRDHAVGTFYPVTDLLGNGTGLSGEIRVTVKGTGFGDPTVKQLSDVTLADGRRERVFKFTGGGVRVWWRSDPGAVYDCDNLNQVTVIVREGTPEP